jgi:hypothetical protein
MKIKPILANMSGRLQGIVASHNRGGQYFRGRTIPDTPPTPAQSGNRVNLTNCVNRWTTVLTGDQRALWNNYAATNPEIDEFGNSVNIGGLGWYVRANLSRFLAGLSPVDDAPGTSGPATFTITPPVLAYAAGDVTVAFDDGDPWANEDGGALLVFDSAPVSLTRYSAAGIPLRFAGAILGDSGTAPTSPATITPAFTFPGGYRMFFKLVAITADGRRSADYRPFLDSTGL